MRRSSDSGISVPSAFAALRLTMSSTLTACCTGRSAGLSPLRKRPVKTPAWRYASVTLAPLAHETASGYIFAIIIDCRQRTLRGQGSKQYTLAIEERIGADHQCGNLPLRKRREGCFQIALGTRVLNKNV